MRGFGADTTRIVVREVLPNPLRSNTPYYGWKGCERPLYRAQPHPDGDELSGRRTTSSNWSTSSPSRRTTRPRQLPTCPDPLSHVDSQRPICSRPQRRRSASSSWFRRTSGRRCARPGLATGSTDSFKAWNDAEHMTDRVCEHLRRPRSLARSRSPALRLAPAKLPPLARRRLPRVQTYETGRRCAGKHDDQLSARCTPIDLSATSHRVSDFGDNQLIVQVCHGEHDLGGVNSFRVGRRRRALDARRSGGLLTVKPSREQSTSRSTPGVRAARMEKRQLNRA